MSNKFLPLAVCGILTILFSAAAYAQIGFPHQFKGKVITNGVAAPDGLSVAAKIGVQEVASTTTVNGNYGRLPGDIFYIEDSTPPEESRYGKTIEFYVNGIKAAEYVFSNSESTELDLSVTGDLGVCGDNYCGSGESCSSCSQDCGKCPDGESGSKKTSSSYTPPCYENWTCSAWSICSKEGKQFRSCADKNNCGTELEKPAEEKTCTYTPAEAPSICTAGTKICSDEKLLECSEGKHWNIIKTCEYGCDPDTLECKSASVTDSGEGSPTGGGLSGFLVQNPAGVVGIVAVIIVILASLLYWKSRKGY